MLKTKLKVGKKIKFTLNDTVQKGEILSVSMNGESAVVKYGFVNKVIIKSTDIIDAKKS